MRATTICSVLRISALSMILIAVFALSSFTVLAGSVSYSGTIDGTEPREVACHNDLTDKIGPFQVTATDTYTFTSTASAGVDIWLTLTPVYNGGSPVSAGIPRAGTPSTINRTLIAGTDYYLIIIDPCDRYGLGSWEISISSSGIGDSDPDGDGISSSRDNCPHEANASQEDGWGSAMGDACDTNWYNMTGIGIAGFEQKNGEYHLHGNCTYMADGDPRCPEIAVFDPATFTPEQMPMEVTTDMAGRMSVWVHYLHSNNGADVYQVNVYTTNPPQPDTLIDDRLEIHVRGGAWKWYQRGGDKQYNGN